MYLSVSVSVICIDLLYTKWFVHWHVLTVFLYELVVFMCILVYLYVLNVFVCIFGNGIYIFDCIYLYCVNQPVVPKVWILIGVPVLTYIDVFPCISVCIECTSMYC